MKTLCIALAILLPLARAGADDALRNPAIERASARAEVRAVGERPCQPC
jgi:hypothetical protein